MPAVHPENGAAGTGEARRRSLRLGALRSPSTWSPSADETIRKLWCMHTMEYYSAIKRNTSESALMRWMKLEPIIQSEVSQKENR